MSDATAGPRPEAPTPRAARTVSEVCKLDRDNVQTDEHWLALDGPDVVLSEQRTGTAPAARVRLPRATWEAFADWYNTGRFDPPAPRPNRKAAPRG